MPNNLIFNVLIGGTQSEQEVKSSASTAASNVAEALVELCNLFVPPHGIIVSNDTAIGEAAVKCGKSVMLVYATQGDADEAKAKLA